jgi:hypothetical protein
MKFFNLSAIIAYFRPARAPYGRIGNKNLTSAEATALMKPVKGMIVNADGTTAHIGKGKTQ